MVIKVLRGETNEVPTPLAACKSTRSCHCPEYLEDVVAGSEGAILLVCSPLAGLNADEAANVTNIEYAHVPSNPSCVCDTGAVEEGLTLMIDEAATHVARVTFYRSTAPTVTSMKRYDSPEATGSPADGGGGGIFGEVALCVEGQLHVSWEGADLAVDAGCEYGPFYAVDHCGHLIRRENGCLVYTPHRYVIHSEALWAAVRLPVLKADVAGPHRHCYT